MNEDEYDGLGDEVPFENHLTIYIDMLGFRDAIRNPDRFRPLGKLLKTIAAIGGNFSTGNEPDYPVYRRQLRPAITAFSDNLVMSYPLRATGPDISSLLRYSQEIIGYISWQCMEASLLIRGGIAVGPLYHENSIVVGPALVEAYEYEAHHAIYPRLAISPSVLRFDPATVLPSLIKIDQSGVHSLNYVDHLLARTFPGGGAIYNTKAWSDKVRERIRSTIEALETSGAERQRAKWQWLSYEIEDCLGRNPQSLEPPFR